MPVELETCENCGRSIGKLETPQLWRDSVVCAECHRRLQGNVPKRETPRSSRRLLVFVPLLILLGAAMVVLAIYTWNTTAIAKTRTHVASGEEDARIRQLPLFADYPGVPSSLGKDTTAIAIRQMQLDMLRYVKSKVGREFSDTVEFYDAKVEDADKSRLYITLFTKNGILVSVEIANTPENVRTWAAVKRGRPVRIVGSVLNVGTATPLGYMNSSDDPDFLTDAEWVKAHLDIDCSLSFTIGATFLAPQP